MAQTQGGLYNIVKIPSLPNNGSSQNVDVRLEIEFLPFAVGKVKGCFCLFRLSSDIDILCFVPILYYRSALLNVSNFRMGLSLG